MNKKVILISLIFLTVLFSQEVLAAPLPGIDLQVNPTDNPTEVVDSLKLLTILTIITLAPALIMMMTSFTRIVIVLSFVRNALATQQSPPNQVLIGLALFLTFFTMAPVYQDIKVNALDPYVAGSLSQEDALTRASEPLKNFMMKQTREKDLALFVKMSKTPKPKTKEDVSLTVLVPAFIISELKTAFQMGFLIYIPFLVIDMVVASTLMSMGMVMVPPIMISLPFKLLLFVITDGWFLVVKSLLESFG
ncbi:flagellar biosynthetic protein FliP [Desulfonispora thiosulfatigenes DSM 11270]|uniref:Flagellar biosynthetic protein FliP n=1 Tax=Desulfonispora thiosulfatigenes DSM 11270 TaxID=656914 RepID=A0A1W1UMR3_DESTI|nr:flagellar type III secretion system pore protein FliP [Desulfonispora thiosulfatigenes]SMB82377.1 flagellar biosynthetic protein FliP [Desulfonispora thiosulfatigenes DSM 11270]